MSQPVLLTAKTVRSLLDLIDQQDLSVLPSMHKLARKLGISVWTVRAAVKQLVGQGRLRCSQGRPITVAGRAPDSSASAATTRLSALLERRIVDGEYRVNQPLPKAARIVLEEHVSPNTVAAALVQLRDKELIHKAGKRWIAGPGLSVKQSRRTQRFRSVLLLTPLGWESRNFYSTTFITAFSRALVSELHDHGTMLSLAFFDKASGARSAEEGPVPSGVHEIRSYVKALGDDYLGTMIYFGWGIPDSAAEVVRMLTTFGKPILDFDHGDRHQMFSREVASWNKSVWRRCHFDERAAVEVAVQALAERGHSIAGVPVYLSESYNWTDHRVSLIKEIAAKAGIVVETREQKEKFWKYESDFDPGSYSKELLAALLQSGMQAGASPVLQRQSLRSLLLNSTPSLTDLIKTKGLSALIALSDDMAREIYLWLKFAGIRVPESISLVSFDNNVEFYHMPVSTVDFGFARLGYLAAHAFIGDIPVRAGRGGEMPGICTLINKGSIGPANRAGRMKAA